MKVVLLTIGRLEHGGAQMRLLELFRRLQEDGAAIRPIVYVVSGLPGCLDAAYRTAGVELVHGRTGFAGLIDIFKLCRERKVAVFHGNTLLSSGLYCAAAWLAGVQCRYAHLRNTAYPESGWRVAAKSFVFAALTRLFATQIVGVCDAARELVGVGRDRWLTIYNGLEVPAEEVPREQPAGIRLLMLGRLDRQKAPLRLVPIAAELAASAEVSIDVVGALGNQGAELRAAVAEAGLQDLVHFAGASTDSMGWLRRSSVLVSLSRHEGLPGVVLEALSVGTPVVATDLPGVREIAAHLGGVRIMDDDAKPADWAGAILAAAAEAGRMRAERAAAFRLSPFVMDRHVSIMRALWLEGFAAASRVAGFVTDSPTRQLVAGLRVVSEAVLIRDEDGGHHLPAHAYAHQLADMLRSFQQVTFVARVRDGDPSPTSTPVEALGVSVAPLPFYKGLKQFVFRLPSLVRAIVRVQRDREMALLRLPGPIGTIYGLISLARRQPFAVQIVGRADEIGRMPGVTFLDRLAASAVSRLSAWMVKRAQVVTYVTAESLQRAYPPSCSNRSYSYSNIHLERSQFAERPGDPPTGEMRLVFAGTLEFDYKGLGVLLEAVQLVGSRGVPVRLDVLGDGVLRNKFERQAATLGLGRVHFHGLVDQAQVIETMRQAHVFVLPSLGAEGLPRALIEAMAQGMPCIGSDLDGVRELLSPEGIFPRGDAAALADRIDSFASDPDLFARSAARNLETARGFEEAQISPRRRTFFAAAASAFETAAA
jgi:phosphatidyl-myo-inositol dimannoside synthase